VALFVLYRPRESEGPYRIHGARKLRVCDGEGTVPVYHVDNTVIPRLTKIIHFGITFVSRNLR
jgi:hypothetical protein